MAFAAKTESVEIDKGKEAQGVWFGYDTPAVPFPKPMKADPKVQAVADKHLEQAIAEYKKAVELGPDDPRAQLGYAWCLDQAGKKEEAIAQYRKTIEKEWENEKKKQEAFGFNFSIVIEAAGYLKPHLDKEKDKAEIAALDEKIAHLNKLPRAVTPIAIPLQAGLSALDITAAEARVAFDADGSGEAKHWSWIRPNAAWLVYDRRGEGKPASALQLFGNVTFWCFWENGYHALAALDDNGDRRISGAELAGLALWQDLNSNGVADPGEVRTLTEHGITSLNCDYKIDTAHPDQIPFAAAGVTFKNGETRPTYDLMLHKQK